MSEPKSLFWLIVRGPGMTPRRVRIEGEGLILGRDPDSDVCLEDLSVSRKQARVFLEGEAPCIEDLSRRGNLKRDGQPVKKVRLDGGGAVSVGPFSLTVERDGDAVAGPETQDDARGPSLPGRIATPDDEPDPRAGLDVLATLVESFDLRQPSHKYLASLLGALLKCVGAERGFLYSVDLRRGKTSRIFGHTVPDAIPGLAVSESLILKTARERKPLLLLELDPRAGIDASASIARLAREDLQSVILCPLVSGDRLMGVLYVDSRVKLKSFCAKDLRLLETVSGAAARLIDSLQAREELESENVRLWQMVEEAEPQTVPVEALMAPESPARKDLELCRRAASRDVTVLITGETGTGKEVMARWIHRNSSRKGGPFVPINCAAVPESLIEAELFGHAKGAFTGATEDRAGVMELADGGTLFLDEIGELSMASQSKLLRVIQDRVVVRVGETRARPVDFRLIAATLRNLETRIAEGSFREDLYYRLNVLQVSLSTLRARTMDLPLLLEHFLQTLARRLGSPVRSCAPGVVQALSAYSWPGNVRQLRNAVERALVVEAGDELTVESLPPEIMARLPQEPLPEIQPRAGADAARQAVVEPPATVADAGGLVPYGQALRDFERAYFSALLKAVGHNVSAIARKAKLTRFTVYRKLGQIGLDAGPDPAD